MSEEVNYLFSWNEIPGNDSVRLIDFLKQKFGIDWVITAKIEKIDDGRTVKVSLEKKSILLRLNDEKNEANLEIDDGRTYRFIVKTENGKLNLYEVNISQRIERLINKVNSNLRSGSEETQRELALLINLLPDLEKSKDPHVIGAVEVAISGLLLEKPNIRLANEIRNDIEQRIPRRQLFNRILHWILHSRSPPTNVVFGLVTFLYIAIPLLMIYLPTITGQIWIFGVDISTLLWIGFAGALGSIVSIMVRLQDFTLLPNGDKSILFFTGFFKPVVGASFALFVFAAWKAGLIPVTIESNEVMYFFMALSFVSGFSERFAKDIATKTEQKIP